MEGNKKESLDGARVWDDREKRDLRGEEKDQVPTNFSQIRT